MLASELISLEIPTLKPKDSVALALDLLSEYKIELLPVVDKENYLGMATEKLLENIIDDHTLLTKLSLECQNETVAADEHFFDILKKSNQFQTNALAVLDINKKYLGTVYKNNILEQFSQNASFDEKGGIIILSLNKQDYALSQISRLVESCNGKVLHLFISNDKEDPMKIDLFIKTNLSNLLPLKATFERFSYQIRYFHHENTDSSIEAERLEHLFKYINI